MGRWIWTVSRGMLPIVGVMLAAAALTTMPDHSLLLAAEDREDTAHERQAVGLLHARCAVCHSTDLVIQQRLAREQWTAIVNKMAHWGAQVSASEQQVLVDYLATRYHPDAAARTEQTAQDSPEAILAEPTTHVGVPPLPAGRPEQGQQLFGQNCVPCHGPAAAGGMGPKLAKNPILADERRFLSTVRQGRGAMPAWGTILTAQEIADIQVWLKTLE